MHEQRHMWFCVVWPTIRLNGQDCGRPSEWRSVLRHCITVLAVPLEILGLSPGTVAVTGRLDWSSVVRIREGFGRQGCPCPIGHY